LGTKERGKGFGRRGKEKKPTTVQLQGENQWCVKKGLGLVRK